MSKKTNRKKTKSIYKININTIIIVVTIIIAVLATTVVFRDDVSVAIRNFGREYYGNQDNNPSILGGNTSLNLPVELGNIGLEVHFINVGQGDSIVIRLPDGKDIIVDAGTTSGIKVNDYLAYLDLINVENFEYMIITHPDADHINLLDDVLVAYDVSNIYYNDYYHDTREFGILMEKIIAEQANLILFDDDGDTYYIDGDDYLITIYAPGYGRFNSNNAMSPIISIEYAGRKILLTGDAERETESWFMEIMEEHYDCDIIKVGHHGSDTSSTLEFLEFITAEYAVISVAETSRYKHPSPLVMNNLYNLGVVTYRTNRHGNIVLYIDDMGEFAFGVDYQLPIENNKYLINDRMIMDKPA